MINGGNFNLGNATAVSGAITINGGTIDNTSGAAITLLNTVNINGDFAFGGTNNLNLGTGAIALSANRTITTNGTANLTIGGVISGAFALAKSGSGTMTLTALSNYSGGTTVNGGSLVLSNGGAAGVIEGALTINSGATVKATVTDALGYNAGSQVTTINVNGGTFDDGVNANQGYRTNFNLTGGSVTSTGGGQINFTVGFGITSNASATSSVWSAPILLRDSGNTMAISVADGAADSDLVISGVIAGGEKTSPRAARASWC
ncbi:MAG: autotransporter-associated beta strand repeat-containing protein [Chthoniobacteraceae bacterium]